MPLYSMKRRLRPQSTGFQQLEGLPLRLIALKCSNPGPLAASCKAAHASISTGGDFEVEWFLRWVHVLAPLRPWQYAAICWQRLGGAAATAEQLCNFILRISEAQQKLQKQSQLPQHLQQPSSTPVDSSPPQAQELEPPRAQQQQQQADADKQGSTAQQQQRPPKPNFSTYPHLVPQLKVLQQAKAALNRGNAIRALFILCPSHLSILQQYAALAGNLQLLQQLIEQQDALAPAAVGTFPTFDWWLTSQGFRQICLAQMCAYAALKTRDSALLRHVLRAGGSGIKDRPYQVWQLFRFACRHSDAACLQLLLEFAPCNENFGQRKLQPWPQHLTMAAARVDPWAAGVVSLLLRVMSPKLLAAKFMVPAYTAACRNGHMPVLQQLLQVAAAAPAKHLPLLLKAAAAAANRSTLQLLLSEQRYVTGRSTGSSSVDGSVSCSACGEAPNCNANSTSGAGSRVLSFISRWWPWQEAQASSAQEQQQVPDLPWSQLSPDDWGAALLEALEGLCPISASRSGQMPIRLAADQDRVAMADQLWQLLGSRGLQSEARSYIQELLSKDVSPWASFGATQQLLSEAPPGKLAWLLQHQLLPPLPPDWQPSPAAADLLGPLVVFSLRHGLAQAGMGLWQLSQQLQVEVPEMVLLESCINGSLRQAAAAHNTAQLQQCAALETYLATLQLFETWWFMSFVATAGSSSVACMLLLWLSCIWTMAVMMDRHGFAAQAGLSLQASMRLAAAVGVPRLLRFSKAPIPAAEAAAAVWGLLEVIIDSSSVPRRTRKAVDARTQRMQAVLQQLEPQLASDEKLLLGLHQLADLFRKRVGSGTLDGIPILAAEVPAVCAIAVDSARALAAVLSKGDSEAAVEAIRAMVTDDSAFRILNRNPCVLESVSAAAAARSTGDRHPAPAAAARSTRSTQPVSAATSSDTDCSGGHSVTVPPPDAAAGAAEADSHGLPMNGCTVLMAAAMFVDRAGELLAARQAATPQAGTQHCAVLPLWQHAALALVAKETTSIYRKVSLDLDWGMAMAAALQPSAGVPAYTPPCLVTSAHAPAQRHADMPAPLAAPAPPEQQLVSTVALSNALGPNGVHLESHWQVMAHRPDVLVWALQTAQKRLLPRPWSPSFVHQALVASLAGHQILSPGVLSYDWREPALQRRHDQEVQLHLAQRAASVVEGFGALPCFAAAAVEAVQSLVQADLVPYVSALARSLSGCRGAGMVQYVKAVIAGLLAVPMDLLAMPAVCRIEAKAVRKVTEVGDVDLLALLLMLDQRFEATAARAADNAAAASSEDS